MQVKETSNSFNFFEIILLLTFKKFFLKKKLKKIENVTPWIAKMENLKFMRVLKE